MTVAELITALQQHDPAMIVVVSRHSEWAAVTSIHELLVVGESDWFREVGEDEVRRLGPLQRLAFESLRPEVKRKTVVALEDG